MELETWQINGQNYVTPKEAARYLGLNHLTVLDHIMSGKLPVVRIESRQFIELDTLKAYAENRRLKSGGWGRVDEFLGRK